MQAISVVVPIYNGAQFLRRCFESILAQDLGLEEIRVLAIDDGSSDSSAAIVQEFAQNYPESFELISQENAGPAAARNRGIELARSEFIAFIDQDDWIEPDYFSRHLEAARAAGADIVVSGYRRVAGERVVSEHPASRTVWYPYIQQASWAKLHRTELIQRAGIRFLKTPFGEDIPFTVAENIEVTAGRAKRAVLDYTGYTWFCNPESLTNTLHKNFADIDLFRLLERLKEIAQDPLSEYEILVAAVYALMYSNSKASRAQFVANCCQTFEWIEANCPGALKNEHIKRAPQGCPAATKYAVRLMIGAWRRGLLAAMYFLYKGALVRAMGS